MTRSERVAGATPVHLESDAVNSTYTSSTENNNVHRCCSLSEIIKNFLEISHEFTMFSNMMRDDASINLVLGGEFRAI